MSLPIQSEIKSPTQALARQYRPRSLQTMVGQEATLLALTNALESQRIHHAYLFTGTRGVGKTTLARILAKCLNCEKGISARACDNCSTCIAIDEGRFVDLIEVDAASRTKVEDTRELLDNVQYLPSRGRFKIYLIDEVHMLSSHSFNALLKTLEEPPPYVKFLLATTDPQKLPATILSRCLQFHLHHLPIHQIIDHLKFVLNKEQASFEEEALQILAQVSEGSMRDALSLLEQVLSYGQGKVSAENVGALLGLSPKKYIIALLDALISQNAAEVLTVIRRIADRVPDFSSVLSHVLTTLHEIAIAQSVPEYVDENVLERQDILRLANQIPPEDLQLYYQIALLGQRDLPYAPNAKMGFEMIMLRMLAFQPVEVVDSDVSAKMPAASASALHTSHASHEPLSQESERKIKVKAEFKETEVKEKEIIVIKEDNVKIDLLKESQIESHIKENHIEEGKSPDWANLIQRLNLTGLAKELAQHCIIESWSSNFIHLAVDESHRSLLNKRYEDRLREAIIECLGFEPSLRLKISSLQLKNRFLKDQGQNQSQEQVQGQGKAQTQNQIERGKAQIQGQDKDQRQDPDQRQKPEYPETPAEQKRRQYQEAELKAKNSIESDPGVQNLLQAFDAELEQVSVDIE